MNEDLKIRLIEYRRANEESKRAFIKDKELKSDVIKFFENSEFSNLSLAEQSAIIIFGYKPKCDCGNFVKFESNRLSNFYSTEFGSWRRYCSAKCNTQSPEFKLKINQANLNRSDAEIIAIKSKIKSTNIKKYGVENPSKNEEIKAKIKKTNLERYGVVCTLQSEIAHNKTKRTNLELYGVEHVSHSKELRNKAKKTNIERYGVENVSASNEIKLKKINTTNTNFGVSYPIQNPEIKEKTKETNIERYGVENVFSNEKVKSKIKSTNIKKYGVENPSKNEEIKAKIKKTNLDKYGCVSPTQSGNIKTKVRGTNLERYGVSNFNRIGLLNINPEFCLILESNDLEKIKSYIISIIDDNNLLYRVDIAKLLGYNIVLLHRLLKKIGLGDKYTNHKISYSENELFEFISGLIPESTVIQSDRTILSGKELDIYIPDYNLAIEFNGVYWHSESNGKGSNYHLDKTNLCSLNDIQLLHIYDIEWDHPVKKEIWKSIIKSKLGLISEKIPARKCEFKIITPNQSREFLEVNHLNGFCGAEVHYGLIYNDDLVSVLSIGKSRFNKGEYEIIRFASKINTLVQGGFSKILKHIDSKYKSNLVTFADRRYSNGLTYRKYFKLETETSPNWYGFNINEYILKHRFSFQKHKLKELFGSTFDENLTAYENMLNHDFDRIWDAGNFKFNTLINS